ncbi:hypothetical protein [Paenarthrobacter ureafaciens]|uniref:hypothetical protein n=1 Tax=Paenarthrobacter ureafaciens TaxID=37931 RepID=UPI003CEFCC59
MGKIKDQVLPDLTDFSHMVNELEGKAPGELTLLSMAYLDSALRQALVPYLEPNTSIRHKLFMHTGALLRNLSPKIDIAAGLSVISQKVWEELHRLCKVRDYFAHGFQAHSWDDPRVQELVAELKVSHADRKPEPGSQTVMEEVELDGVSGSDNEPFIDVHLNDFIIDPQDRIAFFCLREASDTVTEPVKRRFLESYWTCLFLLMQEVIHPWQDRVNSQ